MTTPDVPGPRDPDDPTQPWSPPQQGSTAEGSTQEGPTTAYPWAAPTDPTRSGPVLPHPGGDGSWTGPHQDDRPEDRPLGASGHRPADPYRLPGPQQQPSRSGPPFWLGLVAGLLSPVILGVLAALLGDAASYLPVLSLVGVIALVAHPRTRRFGLGALLGTAILLIVAAGACVALIVFVVDGLGG